MTISIPYLILGLVVLFIWYKSMSLWTSGGGGGSEPIIGLGMGLAQSVLLSVFAISVFYMLAYFGAYTP